MDLGFDATDPDVFTFDADVAAPDDFGFDGPVDFGLDLLRVP